MECQKAMEREKIAKGMCCRREDEIQLRQMQMMQMKEKADIEAANAEIDKMWHRVLLDDIRMKEERDRVKAERLKRGMQERRQAYDEQITTANRMARNALKIEREEENRRIEEIKKKMEEEYNNTIKEKIEQQSKNRTNYIEGHEQKMSALRNRILEGRATDQRTIDIALKALCQERHRKISAIRSFKKEQQLCIENTEKERKLMKDLEIERDKIASEWKAESERENDGKIQTIESEKRKIKEKMATEYRNYITEKEREIGNTRKERWKIKEDVNKVAFREIELKLKSANEELRKQVEYRKSLEKQIQNNQNVMWNESLNIEIKQKPFTKRAIMFEDAMRDKMNPARKSTNPVHPFRRVHLKANQRPSTFSLPGILK